MQFFMKCSSKNDNFLQICKRNRGVQSWSSVVPFFVIHFFLFNTIPRLRSEKNVWPFPTHRLDQEFLKKENAQAKALTSFMKHFRVKKKKEEVDKKSEKEKEEEKKKKEKKRGGKKRKKRKLQPKNTNAQLRVEKV